MQPITNRQKEYSIRLINHDRHQFNQFKLTRLFYSVGCQEEATIQHPTLFPEHAILKFENGFWIIKKTHPGAPLSFKSFEFRIKKLNTTDIINLGDVLLEFIENEYAQPETSSAIRYQFTVTKGPDKGKKGPIASPEVSIGRIGSHLKNPCFELTDALVSHDHVTLIFDSQHCLVRDNNSLNGTYVNKKRIVVTRIKAPFLLTLGNSSILIHHAESGKESVSNSQTHKYSIWKRLQNSLKIS